MPRLKDDTYAARRQHIVDSARACFARRGFHATSMADLQHEADVSAGAIYVYFPGKAALVQAVVEEHLDALGDGVDAAVADEPAFAIAVARLVGVADRLASGPQRGVAFDVWGEALREEAIGGIAAQRLGEARCACEAIVRRAVAAGDLPRSADPRRTGEQLFALAFPGYITQRLVLGGPGPRQAAAAIVAALGGR
jgi:AcrR family transcriptional regulator